MPNAASNFDDGIVHAALSDIGMRRSNNQDSFSVARARDAAHWQTRGHLFIVADGMGAHAAGELASKLAVDGIPHLYHKYRDLSPPEALEKAVHETNTEVHRRGEANADFHQMGTTCSVMTLLPQGALLAHIGDSRIYRLRGDQLEQLTFDHSLVWEMRVSGQLPPGSELAASLPKNVITRSLGPNPAVRVDLEGPFPTQVGDTFLMCSDGLTGQVADDELAAILAALPLDDAAQFLVDLANLRGGPDNITVILVKIVAPELTTAATGGAGYASSGEPYKLHPQIIVWSALGAALLTVAVGLALASSSMLLPAIVLGAVSLGCLGYGGYQFYNSTAPRTAPAGQRYGRGPHTRTKLEFTPAFIEKLTGLAEKLREAAKEQEWPIAWLELDGRMKQATAAAQSGDRRTAVQQWAGIISYLMQQARTNRSKKASDSSIDLV